MTRVAMAENAEDKKGMEFHRDPQKLVLSTLARMPVTAITRMADILMHEKMSVRGFAGSDSEGVVLEISMGFWECVNKGKE